MRKESKEGFRGRLNKAIGYTVIGLTVGFIIGFLTSSVIPHWQAVEEDPNRIALTGYYTAVVVNKEYMDEEGEIWIIDSQVVSVSRD